MYLLFTSGKCVSISSHELFSLLRRLSRIVVPINDEDIGSVKRSDIKVGVGTEGTTYTDHGLRTITDSVVQDQLDRGISCKHRKW